MRRLYAEVALPPPLNRQLVYGLPSALEREVQPGSIVLVPVVRRLMSGVVVGFVDPPLPESKLSPENIRDVSQVLGRDSYLDQDLIEICRWMAGYYFAPLGTALSIALPPGLQLASKRQVRLRSKATLPRPSHSIDGQLLDLLASNGPLKVTTLRRRLGTQGLEGALRRLVRHGQVELVPFFESPPVRRQVHMRLVDRGKAESALAQLRRRARRQAACLSFLLGCGSASRKTMTQRGFSASVLDSLCARGLIKRFDGEVLRDPLAHIKSDPPVQHHLTPAQQTATETIEAALDQEEFFPVLLQGVTGSGKTQVYICAVAKALKQGRGAIVLVPEIALAWQVVRQFKARFGEQVAVLHSQLSAGERYDTWRRLRRGEQRVVIGARSAVLAPIQRPGLIVVDEEHDGSYKQEDPEGRHSLSYNARDLALMRGKKHGAVVILGSATPSLESYWNARSGKYHHLTLPQRIDARPLPRVEIVDMRQEPFQKKQRAIFSRTLRLKIRERLLQGEKIVLLQNRRGFSPFLLCSSCGSATQCKSCRVSLTCHRSRKPEMRCHYCNARAPIPESCSHCGSVELRFQGVGTQRVEEALLEQFPGVRVIRMDLDTTAGKNSHDELVERFRRGEADLLLGTQMVAKGLDFPEVTLVGVISADTGMHLPEFRAAERSFQLLTQVAGRSGRGPVPGEVVIQTLLPEAPVLRAAARQDFAAFVEQELKERRAAGYPPFGRLIVFLWSGLDEEALVEVAQESTSRLRRTIGGDAWLLGPAPAPLARLRDRYRWQALLRGSSVRQLHALADRELPNMRKAAEKRKVRLTVNVDPLTMM